ncbi:MAG: cell wall hydrolase [Dorea sp.]|nr:cell wall hydrolase [Dorea sp.]
MIRRKRLKNLFMLYSACAVLAAGFTSHAASIQPEVKIVDTKNEKESDQQSTVMQTVSTSLAETAAESVEAQQQKIAEDIERKEQEAKEKAEREAAMRQNQALLAAIIYCEAGNQPYEGQIAVGAVIMNRVKSSAYPNTIEGVIYQSGQFGPAATGWLDQVRNSGSYTQSCMQAAVDALNGVNPIGGCLYFDQGGCGTKIGAHYFH